jgi:colanic acid biosynthesis glycosyl transferase WcaI
MRWFSLTNEGSYRLARVAHALGAKTGAVRRLWIYLTFALSSLLNGWRLGRQDVVVCLSTPMFGVWTTWLLAKFWRARHVRITFDVWPESIRNAGLIRDNLIYRVVRFIDTLNCRWSDVITVLGEGMRQQLLDRRLPSESIRVIPFWIDAKRIQPLDRDNAWRREQGIGPEKFVALFAGTIGYASGAQMLADAAADLAGRTDVLFLVVGEGPVKLELEEAARKRKLGNMQFLPFQPHERLSEMQSAADVGLVTLLPHSGFSSVPSKVLGYMAAGRAVIASAPPETDTARLVQSAECGLVTAVQDPLALAQAIRELADDRVRCAAFGANSRRYLVEHFARETVVHRYREVILDSLASVRAS